jgi:hypothetical protein
VSSGVQVEGSVTSGGVDGIIDSVLGDVDEAIPVVLVMVDETLQTGDQPVVFLFCLTVCLRVRCCGGVHLDALGVHEGSPTVVDKASVAVRDDFLGETVVSPDMEFEEVGDVLGC